MDSDTKKRLLEEKINKKLNFDNGKDDEDEEEEDNKVADVNKGVKEEKRVSKVSKKE